MLQGAVGILMTRILDKCWENSLSLVADNGHLAVCQLIITNVEDKNPKGNDGITPFKYAMLALSLLESLKSKQNL